MCVPSVADSLGGLERVWDHSDFHHGETEVEIALDAGQPEMALDVLMREPWERFHCCHRRGELSQAARISLKHFLDMMSDSLGEDVDILGRSDRHECAQELGFVRNNEYS